MDDILSALMGVIDPELGINIVDLGLVYDVQVTGEHVMVQMTMTTPACPLSASLTGQAEAVLRYRFPHFAAVQIELVWEPLWHPMMISPAAKDRLGWT